MNNQRWYHKNSMVLKLMASGLVISGLLLAIIFRTTTPSSVHPLGLLAVFFLLYIIMLLTTVFLLYAGRSASAAFLSRFPGRTLQPFSLRAAYLYASVLAFGPIVLLAMQSVAVLGWTDILLVIAFEIIACFYVWRRS